MIRVFARNEDRLCRLALHCPVVTHHTDVRVICLRAGAREEDIVQIVIKQLENTVITVIKSAVASSKDDDLLRNQEKLGES